MFNAQPHKGRDLQPHDFYPHLRPRQSGADLLAKARRINESLGGDDFIDD